MTPEDAQPPTPSERKRPMTLSEAGRKGGEKVKKERGLDFYAEIGRKGGRRVAQNHGSAFYSEIGRKGGEARRAEPEGAPRETRPPAPRGELPRDAGGEPLRNPQGAIDRLDRHGKY